jgi:hypothetical protein
LGIIFNKDNVVSGNNGGGGNYIVRVINPIDGQQLAMTQYAYNDMLHAGFLQMEGHGFNTYYGYTFTAQYGAILTAAAGACASLAVNDFGDHSFNPSNSACDGVCGIG